MFPKFFMYSFKKNYKFMITIDKIKNKPPYAVPEETFIGVMVDAMFTILLGLGHMLNYRLFLFL
jgi:hypothetical protein